MLDNNSSGAKRLLASSTMRSSGGQTRAVGYAQYTKYGSITLAQNAKGVTNGEADSFYQMTLTLNKAYKGVEIPFIQWLQDKGYKVSDLDQNSKEVTMCISNNRHKANYPAAPEANVQYTLMAQLENDLKEIGAIDVGRER